MSKIEARVIMELVGRPAEHVRETLQTLVVKMGSEKGIKILDKKYHEPQKLKNSDSLFNTFAEVELELESMEHLLFVIYAYSPSNLEIISPENLKISNSDLNTFFNSLLERIHTHGTVIKRAVAERDILFRQIQHLREKLGDKVDKLLDPRINIPKNEKKSESKKKPKKAKKTSKK